MKILILRFSSIGDIIMATAMFRCLRRSYPTAQIDLVVRDDLIDLVRENPNLTNKIGFKKNAGITELLALTMKLNEENYDKIYDAHRSLRTRIMMPLLKANEKAYYKKRYIKRALSLAFKIPLLDRRRMLERFIDPILSWKVPIDSTQPIATPEICYDGMGPEVFVSDEAKKSAFSKVPLDLNKEWIGVVPSARWPGKRWPLNYFKKLLSSIFEKTALNAVIFGSKEDSICQDLASYLPKDRVINTQGLFSLLEAAAVIRSCKIIVSNDTGLLHLADAIGVPSVCFLGPTSAEMGCLPFHPKSRILEEKLWCRPCSKNGQAPCIRSKRWCLYNVTPDRALKATLSLIDELSV